MESKAILAETERLILRRYRETDLEDLLEYLSDGEVVQYEPYRPMTREEAAKDLEWRLGTDEMIAVERKDTHKMIGNVYLGKRKFGALELGYTFRRDCWGRGYGAESCEAMVRRAFAEGVHRVYAECDPLNERSWRLLERLGFRREAHLRQDVYFWKDEAGRPIWKDTYIYGRLAGDR